MNNSNNQNNIGGLFIYKNKNNQNVYYDIVTKRAYIITKQDERNYMLYSSRLVMSVVLGVLIAWLFKIAIPFAIIAGIAFYIATSALFRFKYLASLPVDESFVKTKRPNIFKEIAKETPLGKLVIGCIGLFAVVVIAIVEIVTQQLSGQKLLGEAIIAVGAGIYMLVLLIAAIIKVKNYRD